MDTDPRRGEAGFMAPRRYRLPWPSVLGLGAGLALIVILIGRSDVDAILTMVGRLRGWLILIIAWHACPLLCDALAWQRVFVRPVPGLAPVIVSRWIGEGANALLPVPLLGELLRVRLMRSDRHDTVTAAASVVADITLGLVSQIPFTVAGLLLLRAGRAGDATIDALALLAPLAAFAVGLYAAQRHGLLARAALRLGRSMGRVDLFDVAKLKRFHEVLNATYARPGTVLAGSLWHLAAWVAGAGEIWILLQALGYPIDFASAIVLESLSQAARAAAFMIPGGLGVQDAALVALAGHYGIPADAALSLALAKRVRELMLGLPAIAAGYVLEHRRLMRPRLAMARTD
jgi:putative membrane protein